jgi:hypothetical protein
MKKILFLILFLGFCANGIASESWFGSPGNKIKFTYKTVSTNTLIKGSQGEIYSLSFQSTSANGTFAICDSAINDVGQCGSQTGLGIMAEGAQSVSGNSVFIGYGNQPVQTTLGIYAIVTNGTLIIAYD